MAPSPPFSVPTSSSTVTVRVIDTTTTIILGIGTMMKPNIPGHTHLVCPSYSFLIENPSSGRKVLFDLGVQKEWEKQAPVVVDMIRKYGWTVSVEKDVAEILEDGGVRRDEVEGIIWSHHHWDHLGDPSTFPSSTGLIVGPGFKEISLPDGKPIPNSPIKEEYYAGRKLREIASHEFTISIAGFGAFDYFGDGSFYILDCPGVSTYLGFSAYGEHHTIGHLCALARTTTNPDTFIFLGADIAHHAGEFRPSAHLPLPSGILPNPLHPSSPFPCPGSIFEAIHPEHRNDQPFYRLGTWPDGSPAAYDLDKAHESLDKLGVYDAQTEQVFVILAHDEAMRETIDFFPKDVNNWKERGWGDVTRWVFLRDFKEAVVERGYDGVVEVKK